jgi:hypothetical protein
MTTAQEDCEMTDDLMDLLTRGCAVRFTMAPDSNWTKCWVLLEGHGELVASEFCPLPEDALRQAHGRAMRAFAAVAQALSAFAAASVEP